MEGNGGVHCDRLLNNHTRKPRTSRRPRQEGSNLITHSENVSKISTDDIPAFDTKPRRKEFSLRQCISRAQPVADSEARNNDSRQRGIINRNKRSTEGALAPASWKSTSGKDEGNDMGNGKGTDLGESVGETKKIKLKINGASLQKSSKAVNDTTRSNNDLEETDYCSSPLDKKADLKGATWNGEKDKSMTGKRKRGEPTGSARKSKRGPKKRVCGSEDDDSDGEIRYLEKMRYNQEAKSGRRQLKPSGITNGENSGMDDVEELESVSEEKEIGNEIKRESNLTSRQRALASASGRSSAIEFPDGLPPTKRRKKENLSEMEQQVKKAEAAQRRKAQIEKAERESEAGAIRKILGQDSGRKKREDKNRKRLEELAQEKAAHEERVPSCYIRTIMGPNGTTVSFPDGKMPSMFDPKPLCYPPARENCAGPLCSNPYKYRDSKTKLPLCSLKCYKAVQEQPV